MFSEKSIWQNEGEVITAKISDQITFKELMTESENVFTLLLYYGYLKALGPDKEYVSIYDGNKFEGSRRETPQQYYWLSVPNAEIATVFTEEVVNKAFIKENEFDSFWEVLERFNEKEIETSLHELIDGMVNGRTSAHEDFYEGFVVCMCRYKNRDYVIEPERNSGTGRLDISLEPKKTGKPGIIMELERIKVSAVEKSEDLKKAADAGLNQIICNGYDTVLRMRGVKDIVKMGIAFCGSSVRVSIAR